MPEMAIDATSAGTISVVDAETQLEVGAQSVKHLIANKLINQKLFYSIEVSPIASAEALNYRELLPLPLYTTITWISDVNLTFDRTADSPAFRLAALVEKSTTVLSHLTCYKLTEAKLTDILSNNVRNFCAIRGDIQSDDQPMKHAIDLVRSLRRLNADLSIGVAGYPQVHFEATSRDEDLRHLKEKVDAGADFIITQICFSFDALADFIKSCRALGITCPIIPGIFVPATFASLIKMCQICKVSVPSEELEEYEAAKGDDEKFAQIAVTKTSELMDKLINWDYEKIYGFHFFTLNKYNQVKNILKKFDF